MAGTVTVSPASGASYSVFVGGDLSLAEALEGAALEGGKCAVITDSNVAPLHLESVVRELGKAGWDVLASVEVPAGEASKSLPVYARCLGEVARSGLPRDGTIFALGGGVVGDLGGFVAASYMRGVKLVMLPTTLLAMVDSSVGGKVGVDLPEGKNLAGAFHRPRAVVADLSKLVTLADREVSNGLAEVVKMGLLAGGEFFRDLSRLGAARGRDGAALERLVTRSVGYKAGVVAGDEREGGPRAVLNYGHTIGHALEAVSNYSLAHGEAVSIGMELAAGISKARYGTDVSSVQTELLREAGLPVEMPEFDAEKVLGAMRRDKKRASADGAGTHRFVLLEEVGRPVWGVSVSNDEVRRVLERASEGGVR